MKVEWLIFFYMAVSISMGLFDFGFLFFERFRDRWFAKSAERMSRVLGDEIERNAEFPTEEHRRTLERKLHRLSGMESFDLTMDALLTADPQKGDRYLQGVAVVFEQLAYYFAGRKDLDRAYFAFIVRRWYRKRPAGTAVVETLLRFVREGTYYARENALEALAEMGNAQAFVEAIEVIDRGQTFHHPKLITETALVFAGDDRELAQEFAAHLDALSPEMQVAIINYLRMRGLGEREHLLAMMQDDQVDREPRLACMRYFMSNPWEKAAPALRAFARDDDPGEWEFPAVAATVLAAYPGEETVAVLKGILGSPVWFVRNNAAKSLYDLGQKLDTDLADIMHGTDAYARDMLVYRWEFEARSKGEA